MQIIFTSLIVFLIGLAILVYGYRIFLVILPVWGFFAGFWLGADITSLVLGTGFLGSVMGWVAGFGLGLIFGILSYLFYNIAVAVQAAIIGYGIGSGLAAAFFGTGVISALSGAAAAMIVLIFIFAFSFQKYIVVAVTSILGSNVMLLSVLLLFGRITLQSLATSGTTILPIVSDSSVWLLAWLVLAGIGIWGQIRANLEYEFERETYQEGWG